MNTNSSDQRAGRGFSVVELLVVIAIVAIACAVGVMALVAASRTSALREARAIVASSIRQSSAEASRGGRTIGIDLWGFPISSGVRVRTDAPAPLPESAVVLGSVDLQGGTGYPFSNGTNRAVAVVLEDAADPTDAVAIVLGKSATVTEYRLSGDTWEVVK